MQSIHIIDLTQDVQQDRTRRLEAVQESFDKLVSWATSTTAGRQLHRVEKALLPLLMELGCRLLALWLSRSLPLRVPMHKRYHGGDYLFWGLSPKPVRTRFGVVRHERPIYKRLRGKGPDVVCPDDRRVGLAAGRMSLGVYLLVAYLVAKLPYDGGLDVMRQFGGYVPCKRSALGIVDRVGPEARGYLDGLPPPEGDGEYLFIQVDSKGAPMIRLEEYRRRCRPHKKRPRGMSQRGVRRRKRQANPQKRKKKGDKSKNAKMANIAVVYTLRELPNGELEGPVNKRVIGTFGTMRELFDKLKREVDQRSAGKKLTVFLADGALTIWALQKEYFPDAIPCLDWYHLCEYLWSAGSAIHAEASDELEKWVGGRKDKLRSGDIDAVVTALEEVRAQISKSGPGTKGRRKRVNDALRYIDNHREQIRYHELLALDLDVGTGAVEGAVKHLVGARLDGSGMRWATDRAERVLALRLVVVNDLWSEFEEYATARHEELDDWVVPRVAPESPMRGAAECSKAA